VPNDPVPFGSQDARGLPEAHPDPSLTTNLELGAVASPLSGSNFDPAARVAYAAPDQALVGWRAAEAPPSVGSRAPSHVANQETHVLKLATGVVGFVVAAAAVLALVVLAVQSRPDAWTPVLQDVLKTAYGALAVGLLGGLAKLLLDRRRADETRAEEMRARRYHYIDDVVNANQQVENARLFIRANRSVKTWTEQVNLSLVPACTVLRGISHELSNWDTAGDPMFDQFFQLEFLLRELVDCLRALLAEYGDNKQRLAELQDEAESQKGTPERQQTLNEIWDQLHGLHAWGGFLSDDEEHGFPILFRKKYLEILAIMRGSLA
jgi:hypothetical protein